MSVRLKWDQAKVYIRDASWHPRSDAGGKMPRYHFPHPDDVCMAACSPTRIVLLETSEAAPGEIPAAERCNKPACKRRYGGP